MERARRRLGGSAAAPAPAARRMGCSAAGRMAERSGLRLSTTATAAALIWGRRVDERPQRRRRTARRQWRSRSRTTGWATSRVRHEQKSAVRRSSLVRTRWSRQRLPSATQECPPSQSLATSFSLCSGRRRRAAFEEEALGCACDFRLSSLARYDHDRSRRTSSSAA